MSTETNASRLHVGLATLALSIVGTVGIILACGGEAAPVEPAAPAPSADTSGQCQKDTDCKGDRICSDGKCISPR